jgi:hypothetical protein
VGEFPKIIFTPALPATANPLVIKRKLFPSLRKGKEESMTYGNLQFAGFVPEHETRTQILTTLENIDQSAPSDAVTDMVFEASKGVVKASCRIASKAGMFVADAVNENPLKALLSIEQKIKRQIDMWKRNRLIE